MRFLALALLISTAFGQQTTTVSPTDVAKGWVSLFDGKTFDHWVDPHGFRPAGDAWSIENGCIKANGHPRITEDLFSSQNYRDFELKWEWRIAEGGNSGLKYRIQDHVWILPSQPGKRERFEELVERSVVHRAKQRPDHGQDYVIGFEYQMIDDAKNSDAFEKGTHLTGALYDMAAPSGHATKPAGEWNQSRLVVRGMHVEHWLNGVKVVDSALNSPEALQGIQTRWRNSPHVQEMMAKQPRTECPISLQNHDADTWFRNIQIRKL